MIYDPNNAVKDFIERTIYNLELYIKNNKKDSKYKYENTQILNSFLGIIILPKENSCPWIEKVDISSIRSKIKYEKKFSNNNFFRHMRNAMSHGHFLDDMKIDKQTSQIQAITFKDFDINGEQNFQITLSIKDILAIIKNIKENL